MIETVKSVKIQGQGYLLNGTMNVPMADGNKEYEAIKQWLAEGNVPEPEFTEEELKQQEAIKYQSDRANNYPSIQNQLDMLYWDKINNTNNWEESITAIKEQFPKPAEESK